MLNSFSNNSDSSLLFLFCSNTHFVVGNSFASDSHFWFWAFLYEFNTSYISRWWYYTCIHGWNTFQKSMVEFDRPMVRIDLIGKMSFFLTLKGRNFIIWYPNDSPFAPLVWFSSIIQLSCFDQESIHAPRRLKLCAK